MSSRLLKRLVAPSKTCLRSPLMQSKQTLFGEQLRGRTSIAFSSPEQWMSRSTIPIGWREKSMGHWNRGLSGKNPETPLEHEELPDPLNPHEHPLGTVGHDELSEDKQYWRKRQSEAPKPVYVRQVDENGFAFAVGKRKSSVARVWLRDGTGSVVINGKDWVDYFPRIDHRDQIMRPLSLVGKAGLMSLECSIAGGGNTGQAEALRHGVARALQKWNPEWRKPLKADGLLTRDSRVVESKKYGRKKARKSFQWVKR